MMPNFSKLHVSVEFPCSRCPVKKVEVYEMLIGQQSPAVTIPDGWTLVNNVLYCQHHRVVIDDEKGRG